MNYLVTGAAGFIGKSLCVMLHTSGVNPVPFDIKYDAKHDIRDLDSLRSVIKNYDCEAIFHIAAQAFVRPGEIEPIKDIDINIKGMVNVLECAREFDIPVLYTSSGAVYGRTSVPQHEDQYPQPLANYGCSKLAAEFYLKKYVYTQGLDAKITRFSSVYGPGRGPHGPVNAFIWKALRGEDLTVYGDGRQTRDMIHILDAVEGILKVYEKGRPGEIYNIGLGEEHSVLEIAEIVSEITNQPITFMPVPEYGTFDIDRSCYNIEKAEAIGFKPEISLREGINMTYTIELKTMKQVMA